MAVDIRNLSLVTSFAASTTVPVVSAVDGGITAKATGTQILDFLEANFADPNYTVTRSAPVTGFSQVVSGTTSVWLIWTPAGTLATGTVTLPVAASCFDGMVVLVTSTQAVTALTVTAGAGTTVVGAPTALGAGGFFALRYNTLNLTWYCVAQSLGATSTFDHIQLNDTTLTVRDSNSLGMLALSPDYGAVPASTNYLQIESKDTGAGLGPTLKPIGADAAINLSVTSKGAGTLQLDANTGILDLDGASIDVVAATGDLDLTATAANVNIASSAAVVSLTAATIANITATAGNLNLSAPAGAIVFDARTVGTLPAAAAGNLGGRSVVTDSNAALTAGIGAVVAGGGANVVPVFSDGAAWRIG